MNIDESKVIGWTGQDRNIIFCARATVELMIHGDSNDWNTMCYLAHGYESCRHYVERCTNG